MKDPSRAFAILSRFRDEACHFFKEREQLVECGLVALLSNAHLFILGPPGTAKSMLAETLAGGIVGASHYYAMMHKFLTWRDLACGEVIVHEESSNGKKSIRFRNTEGPLLRAHFVFLDELFKASAATNNSILNLLQERIFSINSGEVGKAALMMAVAASNEMPGSGEEQLRAFADRFLIWHEVDYISVSHEGNTAFIDMLEETGDPPSCGLSLEDVMYLRGEAKKVQLSRDILGIVNSMRAALRLEHRIEPSDRRFKASMVALRAYAFLNGHARVEVGNLAVLEHILWAGREREVRDIVRRVVREFSGETALSSIQGLFGEANETYRDALSLMDRADREIPIDETQRKRREDLRKETLTKERRLTEIADTIGSHLVGLSTRRAGALGRFFLNQTNVLRKALIARRGVEDPFAGAAYASR
jgi:MoxR-like ATPase